jgi:hypothetical protein
LVFSIQLCAYLILVPNFETQVESFDSIPYPPNPPVSPRMQSCWFSSLPISFNSRAPVTSSFQAPAARVQECAVCKVLFYPTCLKSSKRKPVPTAMFWTYKCLPGKQCGVVGAETLDNERTDEKWGKLCLVLMKLLQLWHFVTPLKHPRDFPQEIVACRENAIVAKVPLARGVV